MLYFGGPCDSEHIGINKGLRIHKINYVHNDDYIYRANVVYVCQINENVDSGDR